MSSNTVEFEVHFLCAGERRVTKVRSARAEQAVQAVRDAFGSQSHVMVLDVLDVDGNQVPGFTDYNEV
jgi:hypothetical protein